MKNLLLSFFALLWLITLSFGNEEDRTKVEFFEKLYKTKIVGVKLLEEYPDPDQFYSAIAKQVGIPEIAYKAVEEKFGWKNDEKSFLSLMIKGGWSSDNWGVMVTKFPVGLQNPTNKEEALKLLKDMEMKFVVIGYDGKVTFSEKKKRKAEKINKEVKASNSTALTEDTPDPLDIRTRCIALFRECLNLVERQDIELFSKLGDGGGQTFKISLSPPSFEDKKEADRFWERNFRFDASVAKTKFKEIHFARAVKTGNPVTVKNSETGETIDGKLHTLQIKLPSAVDKSAKKEEMVEAELRVLEVQDRLFWVPFGW